MNDGTQAIRPPSPHHDMNDPSHAPLITHQEPTSLADHDSATSSLLQNDETEHPHQDAPHLSHSSHRQLYLLTLTAGLSGLLFGYDTGIISSTLINLHLSLGRALSITDSSLVTSSTSLFALLASPFAGLIADSLGRKPLIAATCMLFVAGALVQAFATTVWVMVLGRGVVGLAIGAASGVVPVYIGEIAPARSRGRMVTVQALLITGGQVVAYVVGAAVMGRWRVAVGIGALPALVQAVLLLGLPESPRWLVLRARDDEARRVLARLGEDVEGVLGRIREEVKEEEISRSKSLWKEMFLVPGHRRALTIACMLQGLQQLCGFVSLYLTIWSTSRLTIAECPYVLLGDHLHTRRLHQPHHSVSFHRHHQLRLHAVRIQPNRLDRPSPCPAHLDPIHGSRPGIVSCRIFTPAFRLWRIARNTLSYDLEAQPSTIRLTSQSDIVRRCLCIGSWLRTVAARRVIPTIGTESGQWIGHRNKLG